MKVIRESPPEEKFVEYSGICAVGQIDPDVNVASVRLILIGVPSVDIANEKLAPGVLLSPEKAREFGLHLIEEAEWAEQARQGKA